MPNKKLLIGITGGIGSGKSLASKYFQKLGYPVIHADEIAKQLYKTDNALKRRLVSEFGKGILDENGNIGGANARKIILSKKRNIKRVNSLVHPFVIKEIERQVKKLKSKIIIKEAAIIFESGYADTVDYTVLIFANKSLRLERTARRDRIPKAHVKKMMEIQMPEKEKAKLADFIIKNNSTPSQLFKSIKLFDKILKQLA